MSVIELVKRYVGKRAQWTVPGFAGLVVTVRIHDVRSIFGRDELKVTPKAGSGEVWVTVNSVELCNGK